MTNAIAGRSSDGTPQRRRRGAPVRVRPGPCFELLYDRLRRSATPPLEKIYARRNH